MTNFKHIYIPYGVFLGERAALQIALIDRKDQFGIGDPTLSYIMRKTVHAFRHKVTMIDDAHINTNGLTSRNLTNFIKGRKTQFPTLYAIKAYLQILKQLEAMEEGLQKS